MRILGIDASSTAIGWAVVGFSTGVPVVDDSNSKDWKGPFVDRFIGLRIWLQGQVATTYSLWRPAFAIVESPWTTHNAEMPMFAAGMAMDTLIGPYSWTLLPPMRPAAISKEFGLPGNAAKADRAAYAIEQLKESAAGLDEHAIDAAAVAMAAWYQLQEAGVA